MTTTTTDLWQPIPFDRELLKKYDQRGPRYTSYPPAPLFSPDFDGKAYRRLLEKSSSSDAPLSLYVHIPFCSVRCFFCGCNVTIARDRERGTAYLELVDREMAAVAAAAGADKRKAIQIHWGGGTPTFLVAEDLKALMASIRRHFDVASDCEIGVEVDPRECTPEQLDALAESGFNRISMGVQDLSAQVQAAVNRIQPPSQTLEVLDGARQRGMESANVDLIYGLPFQTAESFAATLKQVIDWRPDRLAVFNFAYLPEAIPHQRTIDPAAIPDGETKLRILEETIETLTKAGYIFIGMDHFALPEDPLSQALRDRSLTRNFQGYSTRGEADLLAFGVSAISQVGGGYAQNTKAIPAYELALGNAQLPTVRGLELTPDDELRREVIMRLMCHFLLPKGEIEKSYGIDFDTHFADELAALEPFVADDLITVRSDALEVTPRGRLLVRNIAMVFDAYLKADLVERYSRTV